MMSSLSDSDLQDIIHRVLLRTLGGGNLLSQAPSDKNDPMRKPTSSAEELQPLMKTGQTIALGADHGGFTLKESIKTFLRNGGYKVEDCGTSSVESVDYPDFAYAVAQQVSEGKAWRGIMIDGAGIGSCMVANKVPGIRAAMCYDHATAVNSREHNDANVLTLGAGLIGPNLALEIVQTWLNTDFAGGRHVRRVEKIMTIEKR